MMNICEST